ncbi:hypothetical protein CUJ84_Chr000731 [Rhizobium leguminosarum]|uniref:Uncharacterized protein n=1 Tax=Rhizobium leguminosarum TaxID=384 RepID=A0A2K9YYR9_RHILE|nr:hypothetical protein CUJ84_Chr000731 [Rhizobium leguminosarum]
MHRKRQSCVNWFPGSGFGRRLRRNLQPDAGVGSWRPDGWYLLAIVHSYANPTRPIRQQCRSRSSAASQPCLRSG